MVLGNAPLPAAFPFQRDQVQPLGHAIGGALQVVFHNTGDKGAGDGGLFEDVARIMRREGFQHTFELARLFHDTAQISAGDFFAVALAEHRPVNALLDQIFIHRLLVFEVNLGPAARDFV